MSARHVSFPNSNSFSSAVTGPTKRLVYVSALGAAEDSFRSNGINTTIGRGTEKLDTDDYNNYKILSNAFRVWAAVTPQLKRERLLQEEASRIRVVRGMEDLRRSALAHAFNSLVHACNNSRREREQLVIALEQWSLVLMRKVLRGWHFAALKAPAMEAQARLASDSVSSLSSLSKSNRIEGAPSSSVLAISCLFRWISITLPEQQHGETVWWNQIDIEADRPHSKSTLFSQHLTRSSPLNGSLLESVSTYYRKERKNEDIDDLDSGDNADVLKARLSRLRSSILCRVAPPRRNLPLLEHASARLDAALLVRSFASWKSEARLSREVKKRAAEILYGNTTKTIFKRWQNYVNLVIKADDEEKIASIRRIRSRSVLRVWRKALSNQRRVVGLLRKLLHSNLWRAFSTWRDFAAISREIKRNIINRMRNRCLIECFTAWKSVLGEKRRNDEVLRAVIGRLRNATAHRAFNAFKNYANERRELRGRMMQVAKMFQNSKLVGAVRAWHDNTQENRRVKEIMRMVVVRMQNRELSGAVRSWYDKTRSKKHLSSVMRTVVLRLKNSALLRVFNTFKNYANERRELRGRMMQVAKMFQNSKLVGAVRAWHDNTQENRRVKEIMRMVVVRMQNRELSGAVRSWYDKTRSKKHLSSVMRTVVLRLKNSALLRVFNTFKNYANERRELRGRMMQVAKMFQNSKLVGAVRAWHDNTQENRRVKEIMRMVVVRMQNRELSGAVRSWYDKTRSKKHLSSVMRTVVLRIQNRSLVSAFNAFRFFRSERQRVRTLCARVIFRMMNSKLSSCFSTWQTATQLSIRDDENDSKADALMRNHLAKKAFNHWRHYLQETHRVNGIMRMVIVRLQHRETAMALRLWRSKTSYARTLRSTASFVSLNRILLQRLTVFKAWRRITSAVSYHRNQELILLRSCFRSWLICLQETRAFAADVASFQLKVERLNPPSQERFKQCALRWRNYDLAQAFSAWKRLIDQKRECNRLANEHFSTRLRIQAVDALRSWRAYSSSEAKIQSIMLRVAARFQNNSLAKSVSTWQQNVAGLRRNRQILQMVVAKMKFATAHRAFNAFKNYANERRELRGRMMQVAKMFQNSKLVGAVRAWHDNTQENRRVKEIMRMVVVRMQNRELSGAVRSWYDKTRSKKHLSSVMRTVVLRLKNSALLRVFNTFKNYANERRELRGRMMQVAKMFQNSKLVGAVRAWHENTQENRRVKEIMRMVVVRMQNRELSGAVRSWYDKTRSKKHLSSVMRTVVLRLKNSALLRVFNTFKNYANERRELRGRMMQVAKMFQNSKLVGAVRAWHDNTQENRRVKEIMRMVVVRMQNRELSGAVRSWYDKTRSKKHLSSVMRTVVLRLKNSALLRVFNTFKNYANERRELRGRMMQVAKMFQNSKLVGAVRAWHDNTQENRRVKEIMRMVVVRMQNRELSGAVRSWYDKTRSKKHLSSVMRTVVLRLKNSALLRVFNTFKNYANERRELRGRMMQVAKMFQNSKLVGAVRAWHDNTQENRRVKEIMRMVVVRMQNRELSGAVRSWYDKTRSKKHLSSVMRTVVLRIQNRSLVSAFNAFRFFRSERQRVRTLCARVLHRWMTFKLDSGFHRWQSVIAENKSLKKALQRWKYNTHISLGAKKVREFLQSRKKSRTMKIWKQFVAEVKQYREAMKKESAFKRALDMRAEHVKLSTLRVIFKMWTTRVHVSRAIRNMLKRRGNRVAVIFEAWKTHTSAVRHLKSSAHELILRSRERSLRNVVRTMSQAGKYGKAMRHFRYQLVSKVFRGWSKSAEASKLVRLESAAAVAVKYVISLTARHFQTWRQYVQESVSIRQRGEDAYSHILIKKASRGLAEWRRRTKQLAHIRYAKFRAKAFYNRKLLLSIFSSLRSLTYSQKKKRVNGKETITVSHKYLDE
jgi:AMMECR1 domain-containing protein